MSSLHFLLLSRRSGIHRPQTQAHFFGLIHTDVSRSLFEAVISVLLEIPSALHFISDVKKMKMAIFVKLRLAVEKVLVSLTKINAVHVFPSSNVLAALIILLGLVTVKSVQEVSMMFLESGLTLSAP